MGLLLPLGERGLRIFGCYADLRNQALAIGGNLVCGVKGKHDDNRGPFPHLAVHGDGSGSDLERSANMKIIFKSGSAGAANIEQSRD